jgi:DNA-binding MarR family transcriptional regulator
MSQCQFNKEKKKNFETFRALWLEKIREISGLEDLTGITLPGLIKHISSDYDELMTGGLDEDLSSARLSLLMRLYIAELMGRTDGITATFLSHMQNVNKNTISSLIRGLEDQGLICRENDLEDRRIYRLKLTETGRSIIKDKVPNMVKDMNDTASGLTLEEQHQLKDLLEKLSKSIQSRSRKENSTQQSS